MNPGSKVEIEFERDGKNQKVTLKLDSMDKSSNAGSSNVDEGALEGLSLKNLDDEIRSKYALNKDLKGAIVTNVKADSKASEYGFRKGDIIIQIGQNDVENIDDFNKYIKAYKGKKVLVWVIRNGIPQGLVIR